jgi:hypothetical protein
VSTSHLIFASLLLLGASACAGPQVRSLANGAGPPAYELRGQSLAAIELEAGRLCGSGYSFLRQSQRFATPEGEDNATSQWLLQVGDWLSGMPGNQAQATVVCHT